MLDLLCHGHICRTNPDWLVQEGLNGEASQAGKTYSIGQFLAVPKLCNIDCICQHRTRPLREINVDIFKNIRKI
jgi:hypothetical protein